MANVTMTAAKVAVLYPQKAQIFDRIAAVAIAAGEAVALSAAGKAVLADASQATTLVNPGIALNSAGVGQAVSVLMFGHVAGGTLTDLDYGAAVYVSDDAGKIADAAGTVTCQLGTVEAVAQADGPVKCLFVGAWAVMAHTHAYAAANHTHS